MLTNLHGKKVLVVGGAGFIGSQMVLTLQDAGFEPVVLDNLSKGHRAAVHNAIFVEGDMSDKACLRKLFSEYNFLAVMHFASFIEVAESMLLPLQFYQNNVCSTLSLIEVMLEFNVRNFIFSSTAAVYGNPLYSPINETHPIQPINPYGRSKSMVETMIQDISRSDGLHYAILRYFNAAGADPKGRTGELHDPESHLIPILLQIAKGEREHLNLYGTDYPTKDGTCVRDYIHVADICSAHLLALNAVLDNNGNFICNLGTGRGYSVQEVIDTVSRITETMIPIVECKRREGDPAILIADASFANEVIGWKPHYTNLNDIVKHAWMFMQNAANFHMR